MFHAPREWITSFMNRAAALLSTFLRRTLVQLCYYQQQNHHTCNPFRNR